MGLLVIYKSPLGCTKKPIHFSYFMSDHLFNSEWSDGLNSDCNVQHLICDQVTVLCTLDPGQLNQD
jgi:hypothetical protein